MFLKDSVIKMAEGSKIHVGVDGLHADLAKNWIPSVSVWEEENILPGNEA